MVHSYSILCNNKIFYFSRYLFKLKDRQSPDFNHSSNRKHPPVIKINSKRMRNGRDENSIEAKSRIRFVPKFATFIFKVNAGTSEGCEEDKRSTRNN